MFLYISDQKRKAQAIADQLSSLGFLPIYSTLHNADAMLDAHDVSAAVIDCIPHLKQGEVLCAQLRRQNPTMPLAAILLQRDVPELYADAIIRDNGSPTLLCNRIADFLCHVGIHPAQALTTPSLSMSLVSQEILYMGYSLRLSPSELRVLYCLLYRAPHTISSESLASLCSASTPPSASNLRVQIHSINKKAAEIDPRPLILFDSDGYRLRDSIL